MLDQSQVQFDAKFWPVPNKWQQEEKTVWPSKPDSVAWPKALPNLPEDDLRDWSDSKHDIDWPASEIKPKRQ